MAKKKKKPATAAKKKKKAAHKRPHSTNPAPGIVIPRGMMLVPAGHATKKKKAKKKSGHPHRRNPGGPLDGFDGASSPHHERLKNGAKAVGFGALAATLGLASSFALSKLQMEGKATNVLANVAAGTVIGAAVGAFDRTAGTLVSHNYYLVAGQWMFAPPGGTPRPATQAETLAMRKLPPGSRKVATPALLTRAAQPVHGVDEDVGDYTLQGAEDVDGVMADDMGEYRLQGVMHDDMGDGADLDGVMADDMGDGGELADRDHLEDLGMDDLEALEMDGFDEMGDLGEVTS